MLASSAALVLVITLLTLTPVSRCCGGTIRRNRGATENCHREVDSSAHADGQPDLQGIWVNNSATPLERPKALEGRQVSPTRRSPN